MRFKLLTASVLVLAGTLTAIQGCTVTPTDDGGVRILPSLPGERPRTIPAKRIREVTYKGVCLQTAGGQCWPCEGGTARPCDEWYDIIDDMRTQITPTPNDPTPPTQPEQQKLSVLYTDASGGSVEEVIVEVYTAMLTGAPGTQVLEARSVEQSAEITPRPSVNNHPDFDTLEFEAHVAAMLAADNVTWDRQAILMAYGMIDPMPIPFEFRAALLEANTITETVDIIIFAREDMDYPTTTADLRVTVLPLGELGLTEAGPIAIRISGTMAAFTAQAEGLFPVGAYVDYDNNFGMWSMEAVSGTSNTYGIDLRLGGIVVGSW